MGTSGWSGFSQASTLKLLVLALVLAVAQAADKPYPAHRRNIHRMEVRLGRQLGSRRRLPGDSKEKDDELDHGARVHRDKEFEKNKTPEGTFWGFADDDKKQAFVLWDDNNDAEKVAVIRGGGHQVFEDQDTSSIWGISNVDKTNYVADYLCVKVTKVAVKYLKEVPEEDEPLKPGELLTDYVAPSATFAVASSGLIGVFNAWWFSSMSDGVSWGLTWLWLFSSILGVFWAATLCKSWGKQMDGKLFGLTIPFW